MRRRNLLVLGGVAAWVWGVPRLYEAFQPAFDFSPIHGLDGFRRVNGGAVSSASDIALLGIDPTSPHEKTLRDAFRRNPCSVFGPAPSSTKLPVAIFTDYNCPYCPEISELVVEVAQEGALIRPIWWDMPILGPRSERAARVAIAAGEQGQYLPLHRHLMQAPLRPGPVALAQLAEAFELDPARLTRDADSLETDLKIERAQAAAAVFGLAGTPALIVGRSVVLGRISKQSFLELIELEYNSFDFRDSCG